MKNPDRAITVLQQL